MMLVLSLASSCFLPLLLCSSGAVASACPVEHFCIVFTAIVRDAGDEREACPEGFELGYRYPFFPLACCFARFGHGMFFFGFPFGMFFPHSFEHCLIGPDDKVPGFSLSFPSVLQC